MRRTATPVAPTTAYKLGEKINNPLEMYMEICIQYL